MSSDPIKAFVDKISRQLKNVHSNLTRRTSNTFRSWSKLEETKDFYGVSAPLESYMIVPSGRLLDHFWDTVDVGDIVIGRVTSKLERALMIGLLCFDGGKSQDIESLEISARCPRSEIPAPNNHEDPLTRFSINDLIRAEIISVHRRDEKLLVTLHPRDNFDQRFKLGCISDEDLPIAYKRMCANAEPYDKLLHLSTGFYNPNVIGFLKQKLIDGNFSSLVEDINDYKFPSEEFAPALRKRQSAKVAKRSVTKGINFYRKGKMLEALQELNLALDLDPVNVDAFVARGALYANKCAFAKAIDDFEKALSIDSENKNAKKYLIEVLIERAKTIEQDIQEMAQIKEATNLYKRALAIDANCVEAKTALGLLEKSEKRYKSKCKRSSSTDSASSRDTGSQQKSEKSATIDKVRLLLKHDVGSSRKRKQSKSKRLSSSSSSSSSSTSSSSSSDSSSSSSSESEDEKPATKKRRSSSSQKKTLSPNPETQHYNRKSSASSDVFLEDKHQRSVHRKLSHSRSDRLDDERQSDPKYRNSNDRRRSSTDRNPRSVPSGSKRSSETSHRRESLHDRRNSRGPRNEHYSRRRSRDSPVRNKTISSQYHQRHSVGSNPKSSDATSSAAPIINVTKDNFSNLLDQISQFEKSKTLK